MRTSHWKRYCSVVCCFSKNKHDCWPLLFYASLSHIPCISFFAICSASTCIVSRWRSTDPLTLTQAWGICMALAIRFSTFMRNEISWMFPKRSGSTHSDNAMRSIDAHKFRSAIISGRCHEFSIDNNASFTMRIKRVVDQRQQWKSSSEVQADSAKWFYSKSCSLCALLL